jgi:hypothetical protein
MMHLLFVVLILSTLRRHYHYSFALIHPLFDKVPKGIKGVGGDFLNKSPSIPLLQRGRSLNLMAVTPECGNHASSCHASLPAVHFV